MGCSLDARISAPPSVPFVGEVLAAAAGVVAVVAEVLPIVERHILARVVAAVIVAGVVGAVDCVGSGLGTLALADLAQGSPFDLMICVMGGGRQREPKPAASASAD